uniref:Uncharacterized protein n=1 Tax=Romanomermis culicivorax TaxID=13658 RepID=A0A915HYG8_ROMCU
MKRQFTLDYMFNRNVIQKNNITDNVNSTRKDNSESPCSTNPVDDTPTEKNENKEIDDSLIVENENDAKDSIALANGIPSLATKFVFLHS